MNPGHNLLSLVNLDPMERPSPGQFYMVGVSKGCDPLLKRAFSLFRETGDGFQILYRISGKGTAILRDMKEGTVIDVIGPLGSYYPDPPKDALPVVIAGGIGVASVFSLVGKLSKRAAVFYGARSSSELLMKDELLEISGELMVSTDDGSAGEKGNVIELLEKSMVLKKAKDMSCYIYACGPRPLLKKVTEISVSNRISACVSLEEHMACGLGACLGCVVRTRDGFRRVCKEGPVFDAAEILW